MSYWVLITHSVALFPISIFLWSWKQRKDPASIFMLLKFIFCVTFSLFYHTYDVADIESITKNKPMWILLDGYASTSLIFTTTLYGLRVRPPQFYITSNAVETIILSLYLFIDLWYIITWLLVLACTIICIFKWKTLYRYVLKFYYLTFFTIVFGITATITFCIAVETSRHEEYIKFHSLWHCFIFSTAGCAGILRYKLDSELYPLNTRNTLNSI